MIGCPEHAVAAEASVDRRTQAATVMRPALVQQPAGQSRLFPQSASGERPLGPLRRRSCRRFRVAFRAKLLDGDRCGQPCGRRRGCLQAQARDDIAVHLDEGLDRQAFAHGLDAILILVANSVAA